MGDVTKEDLKTILLFALHMARVDDDFSGQEKTILARFIELVGIDEADKAQLQDAGRSLAQRLDHRSGEEAKTLLVKTLCAVAHADNLMHSSERAFIEKVQALVGGQIELPPFNEWSSLETEVLATLERMD